MLGTNNEKGLEEKCTKRIIDDIRAYINTHHNSLSKKIIDSYKDIKTPLDFLKLAMSEYPLNSGEYYNLFEIFRYNYLDYKYPEEFVLCHEKHEYTNSHDLAMGKDNCPNRIYWNWKKRSEIEWNPAYLQLSVAALIKTQDNKFIILKSIKGNMQGLNTMVQGHCSFENSNIIPKIGYKSRDWGEHFEDYLKSQISKEISEEINVDLEKVNHSFLNYHYIAPKDDPNLIGYYHEGFIFQINIDLTADQVIHLKNLEAEKHNVISVTKDELIELASNGKADDWLTKTVEKIM